MADDIKLVVGVDYSDMTGLIKTTNQTKRALNTISKEFARTNDQSAYMRGVMAIDKAQKNLDPSLRMTRSEIMKLGATMRQEAKFEQALTTVTNNLAAAQTRGAVAATNFRNAQMAATKSSNRVGVVAQQAGYQVSDFVVQIQSGTNPLIAFSQQASQLVGVLPLVADQLKMSATRAIALSAGLGIAIPLISSAAMVFFNMRDSAKEAESELEKFEKSLNDVKSSISDFDKAVRDLSDHSLETLIDRYGEVTQEVMELQRALVSVQEQAAKTKVKTFIESTFTEGFYDELKQGFTPTQQAVIELIADPAAMEEEIDTLKNEISFLKSKIESDIKLGLPVTELKKQLEDYSNELASAQLQFEDAGKLQEELKLDKRIFEAYVSLQKQIQDAFAKENYTEAATAISKIRKLAEGAGIDVDEMGGAFSKLTQLEDQLRRLAKTVESGKLAIEVSDPYGPLSAFGGEGRSQEDIDTSLELTNLLAEETAEIIRRSSEERLAMERAWLAAATRANLDRIEKEGVARLQQISSEKQQASIRRGIIQSIYDAEKKFEEERPQRNEKTQREISASLNRAYINRKRMSRSYNSQVINDSQQSISELISNQADYTQAIRDAIVAGEDLSKLDLKQPYDDTLTAAKMLKHEMENLDGKKISLTAALNLVLQTDSGQQNLGPIEGGRGRVIQDVIDAQLASLGGFDFKYEDKTPKREPKVTQDEIDKLMEAVRVERTRINLGEEEARQLEILQDLRRFNADAEDSLSEKEMKAAATKIAQMEQTNQKLDEQKQKYEELGEFIDGQFEDAFMSIIDGTKSLEDAFRDMARQIIAELMRVLVVQTMVKSFTGGLPFFNANGNAFSNGNVVPYANGGVVGGPTYFPMAGGKTGLMGEAGPEAIMPLKRGKNGKLGVQFDGGQQQSVNIVQNFQFSANGDDSVKRIIASEAPKIAKMTEAQILENRRRGGQFRKAFS